MIPGKTDVRQGLLPFTIIVALLSLLLFTYLYLGRSPVAEAEGLLEEVAEVLGVAGGYALAVIYIRSVLKIAINEGDLLQRFIPADYQELSASLGQRALHLLNRTHRLVGAAAAGLLISHAFLVGTARWNLFLDMLLALLIWQALFGIFLVVRFPPAALRRYGYLVHAQLFSGVMIGIFAGFGHLLAGD